MYVWRGGKSTDCAVSVQRSGVGVARPSHFGARTAVWGAAYGHGAGCWCVRGAQRRNILWGYKKGQLLFNALVLASHDRVTLAQERPYGELYMARGGMFV
jgi:hypothetical protein